MVDINLCDVFFYRALRELFGDKYTEAVHRGYLICIPLEHRGTVTRQLIEGHMLKPSPESQQTFVSLSSTGENVRKYEILNDEIISSSQERIKILKEEQIAKDNKLCRILLLEKPLYLPDECQHQQSHNFNYNITSLYQARKFLREVCSNDECLRDCCLQQLDVRIRLWKETSLISAHTSKLTLEESVTKLRTLVQQTSTELLKKYNDQKLRNKINVALECYIVGDGWDVLFPAVCKVLVLEDHELWRRCCSLEELEVTADQLGLHPDLCFPTPAAVVELASLDTLKTPLEKLQILRTSLDLIIAEVKGALVDYTSKVSQEESPVVPKLKSNDLLSILVTVLAKVRPLHLASTLYFCEVFQWNILSSSPSLRQSFLIFKDATDHLKKLRPGLLKPSDIEVKKHLSLKQLVAVTEKVEAFSPRRHRDFLTPTPMDHHMQRIVELIEKSTDEFHEAETQEATEALNEPLVTFGGCLGKPAAIAD